MDKRLEFHEILCELVNITESNGDRHTYFQPPESFKMRYPAIRYSINDIDNRFADNSVYKQHRAYEVIVIEYDPECPIADKVSRLPMCRFNRFYASNNLNHNVFIIYH